MARKPKPKACKCAQRDGVHEVTCPAFDVDAELDGDLRAPDVVAAAAHVNGSGATTEVGRMGDDEDDEDAGARYDAVVDGDEAIIDPTPAREPMLVPRPTHSELMDALLRARRVLGQKTSALGLAKSEQKMAQLSVDAIVAEMAVAWEERNQLELPLAQTPAAVLCANCAGPGPLVPVGAHDEEWCVPCVKANLIPNGGGIAPKPPAAQVTDDGRAGLGPIIYALSAALRFEDVAEWADVEALANDPRPTDQIAADLARIAGQHSYFLSKTAPFVEKDPAAAELAPA